MNRSQENKSSAKQIRTILIVEDDKIALDLYSKTLKQEGYNIITASNGKSAIEKAAEQNWDIMLLDILLPDIDGLEVLKTIKSKNNLKNKKILLLTNLKREAVAKQAFNLGAEGYLIKSEIASPKKLIKEISTVIISLSFLLLISISALYLAPGVKSADIGIAETIQISESAPPGSIISFFDKNYILSRNTYSPDIIGIAVEAPAVAIEIENENENKASVSLFKSGQAEVKISTINGPIKKGDLITSSRIPGVGMRATKPGYILGVAREDYTEEDPTKIGKIPANINIRFADYKETPEKANEFSVLAQLNNQKELIKYLAAAIIAILAFGFGFMTYGKLTSTAIEAIGRNPLAKRSVLASVVLDSTMTIFIIGIGISIAYGIIMFI